MAATAERIVLASRPVGEPTFDNFRFEEFSIPQPGPAQMLLRTLWLSLDPYMAHALFRVKRPHFLIRLARLVAD